MSPLETPTAQCASCQEPATKICIGCKETPTQDGKIESVVYCSVACQQAHWPTHKADCKSRKSRLVIFRIGWTLQKIFYVFRGKLFDKAIIRVEKKDGKLLIYEGSAPEASTSYDYLQPIPAGMVASDEDKFSILSHLSCNDAIGWMHDLIKYFLSSVVAEVYEHQVKVKGTRRGVMTIDKHGVKQTAEDKMDHNIIKVVLKDKASYALDLTGAQYGYFEPVTNWDDYYETRIKEIIPVSGSGNNFGRVKALLVVFAGSNTESMTDNVVYNNQKAALRLVPGVQAWEDGVGMKVRDICKLPEAEFAAKQENLVAMIEFVLDQFLEEIRAKHEEIIAEHAV